MAWSEHIHIHIHNDDQKEIIKLLREIKSLLQSDDEDIKQQMLDKLNAAIADIKSTVK